MSIPCCASKKNIALTTAYSVGAVAVITAIVMSALKAKAGAQVAMYTVAGGILLATGLVQFCTRGAKAQSGVDKQKLGVKLRR